MCDVCASEVHSQNVSEWKQTKNEDEDDGGDDDVGEGKMNIKHVLNCLVSWSVTFTLRMFGERHTHTHTKCVSVCVTVCGQKQRGNKGEFIANFIQTCLIWRAAFSRQKFSFGLRVNSFVWFRCFHWLPYDRWLSSIWCSSIHDGPFDN